MKSERYIIHFIRKINFNSVMDKRFLIALGSIQGETRSLKLLRTQIGNPCLRNQEQILYRESVLLYRRNVLHLYERLLCIKAAQSILENIDENRAYCQWNTWLMCTMSLVTSYPCILCIQSSVLKRMYNSCSA